MTPLLTADQAALLLGVPESWVREHARLGDLPHRRIGKHLRFTEDDIAAYIAASAHGPQPVKRARRSQPPADVVANLRPTSRKATAS